MWKSKHLKDAWPILPPPLRQIASPAAIPAIFQPPVPDRSPLPKYRENRAAHSLMPPLRLMNWSKASECGGQFAVADRKLDREFANAV
jgi:hypothetical protein